MEPTSLWLWAGFNLFVLAMLAIDLGVFHRQAHAVSLREASIWSAVWIALALVFSLGVWKFLGPQPGVEFLTGYLIEKSLSVDNIFVIALLFAYFKVPDQYQHRVLFWGILGALVMRAAFILAGAALLERFHWMIFVFGAFLIYTGVKLLFAKEGSVDPARNPILLLCQRFLPVTSEYHGAHFFARVAGKLVGTPLFLVLVVVEFTDVIFAVDSIPAIFAVTRDPFLVFTSNVFAILGLRSLYFLLAGVMHKFEYLKLGLAAILVFVGAKMALVDWVKIPAGISLGVIAAILAVAVAASLLKAKQTAMS